MCRDSQEVRAHADADCANLSVQGHCVRAAWHMCCQSSSGHYFCQQWVHILWLKCRKFASPDNLLVTSLCRGYSCHPRLQFVVSLTCVVSQHR